MDLFSVVHRSFKNLAVPFRALTNARILPVVFPGFRASIHLRMLLFLLYFISLQPFQAFGVFWSRLPSFSLGAHAVHSDPERQRPPFPLLRNN